MPWSRWGHRASLGPSCQGPAGQARDASYMGISTSVVLRRPSQSGVCAAALHSTTAQVRSMAILAMSPTGVPPVVLLEFSGFAGAGCPCDSRARCPCYAKSPNLRCSNRLSRFAASRQTGECLDRGLPFGVRRRRRRFGLHRPVNSPPRRVRELSPQPVTEALRKRGLVG
jgi:hypothetical protein